MTPRRRVRAAAAAVLLAAASCGGGGGDGLRVSSSAFGDGDAVPERFSCLGENVSPPIEWSGVPDGTVELALVVTDPDAPSGTFFHWIVLSIPPGTRALPIGEIPEGASEVKGSSENATYIGMCPPQGEEHEYRFTVHALDERMTADATAGSPADVVRAVEERSIAEGTLTGRFRG